MFDTVVRKPKVISNLFEPKDLKILQKEFKGRVKQTCAYDQPFGRFTISDDSNGSLGALAKDITPFARKVFNSKTLVPSYTLFSHYEGKDAQLPRHVDDNACTYTLDYCLYQKQPWKIWVEGVAYKLRVNEALAFYGTEQEHWREEFPNPEKNFVGMIFFHFVEPNHWYFTKGPKYVHVLRKNGSMVRNY